MQLFSLNTGYRRSAWVNPTLFLCTITFIIVFGFFIGYSAHFGFFDYVLHNVIVDTHGAVPLSEKSDAGLAFPCTLDGCNVSGNLGENQYSFYYVTTGSQGMGYVYRVVGNDVRHFNVVTSANGQLPSYPRDSHVQPISDTEIEVLQYVGSCRASILFFWHSSWTRSRGYLLLTHKRTCSRKFRHMWFNGHELPNLYFNWSWWRCGVDFICSFLVCLQLEAQSTCRTRNVSGWTKTLNSKQINLTQYSL